MTAYIFLSMIEYDYIFMIDCDYIASPNCCDGTPEKNLTLWHCQNILSHIYSPSQSSHEPQRYLVSLLAWLCYLQFQGSKHFWWGPSPGHSERKTTDVFNRDPRAQPANESQTHGWPSQEKVCFEYLRIIALRMTGNQNSSLKNCRLWNVHQRWPIPIFVSRNCHPQVLKKFGQWQFNDGLLSPKVHSSQGRFARACWDKLIGFKDHQWQSDNLALLWNVKVYCWKCIYIDINIYIHDNNIT